MYVSSLHGSCALLLQQHRFHCLVEFWRVASVEVHDVQVFHRGLVDRLHLRDASCFLNCASLRILYRTQQGVVRSEPSAKGPHLARVPVLATISTQPEPCRLHVRPVQLLLQEHECAVLERLCRLQGAASTSHAHDVCRIEGIVRLLGGLLVCGTFRLRRIVAHVVVLTK